MTPARLYYLQKGSVSNGSKGRDGRPFGQYDQVALKTNGRPNIRFNPNKTHCLTTSSLGTETIPSMAGDRREPIFVGGVVGMCETL